jgi:hypothetical protein
MRTLSFALVIFFTALFSSLSANAYVIHNKTGATWYFYGADPGGERCDRCYKGDIENGKTGACPGSLAGCRGYTQVFVGHAKDESQRSKYNIWQYFHLSEDSSVSCFSNVTVNANVTAHGDIYFYPDHVEIYNDTGQIIFNGIYEKVQEGPAGDHCWGGGHTF